MASSRNDLNEQTSTERQPKFPATFISRVVIAVRQGFAGRARSQRRMELVETLQLGSKRQLMLVLCDGQKYLVGAGSDSIHSIAEIRDQTTMASISPSILSEQKYSFQPDSAALSADRKMGLTH